ncbi:MAG: alpha/beta hydrolase [Acidobacteriota bacterium]
MSMTTMATLTVMLVIVFVVLRLNLHKKVRKGLPGAVVSTATAIKRTAAGLTFGIQRDVQGFDVAYLDSGGTGPVVLMLHGFAGDKDDWDGLSRHIPGKYRRVAIDLPGFGESSRDEHQKYDTVSQVRRLRVFLDKTRILPPYHLVGSGMGGTIAAIFASVQPKAVDSLTLIEPMGVDAPEKSQVESLTSRGWSPLTASSDKEYERVLSLMMANPPSASGPLQRKRLARAVQDKALHDEIWKQLWENRPFLLEQILPEIKVRTLILWSQNSKVADPSSLKVITQGIPDAVPVLLKGNTAHLLAVEEAKEVAQRWLQMVDPSAVKKAKSGKEKA